MKTGLRCSSAPALAVMNRTVWFRISGTSLARAITRIFPCWTRSSANGGEVQPTSIWPLMTCVSVAAGLPVATGVKVTPNTLWNATTVA